jgi:hypothetical protein
MLSRKQLEDAAKCEKKIGKVDFETQEEMCQKCSCSDGHGGCVATFGAAQTALTLANMCKRLEWVKCPGHEDILFCPLCGAMQKYGHAEDCELSKLRKRLEG